MPSWKKVITSGSNAILAQISASVVPTATTQNLLAIDSSTGGIMQIPQSDSIALNTFKTTGQRDGDSAITGSLTISGSAGLIKIVSSNIQGPFTNPGGTPSIKIDENGFEFNQAGLSSPGMSAGDAKFLINGENEDLDFIVNGKTVNNLLKTDAEESRVEIRNSLLVLGDGHISASGNITASNLQINNDIALGGNIFSFSGFSFIEGVSAVFTGSNIFGSGSSPEENDTAGGGTAHQFTGSVSITGSNLTAINATFDSIRNTSLSEGLVTFAGTQGLLIDDNDFSYNSTSNTLTVPNISNVNSSTHVTASGNISASGTVHASQYKVDEKIAIDTDVNHTQGRVFSDGNITSIQIGRNGQTDRLIELLGPVTASGDVSASGFFFGEGITIEGGTSTFNSDNITLGVDDGDRIHVNGFISTRLDCRSHITASGNISASGYISASEFIGLVNTSQTASYILADNIDQPFTNITASGIISSSKVDTEYSLYANSASLNYVNAGGLSLPNISNVSASIAALTAGTVGDNLGNHTATEDLDLATFSIKGITNITASGVISSSKDALINGLTIGRGGGDHIQNTAIGNLALLSLTSATEEGNTAVGASSMQLSPLGKLNTAVGHRALYQTKASNNTSIGQDSLYNHVIGDNNVALGLGAGKTITGGSTPLYSSSFSTFIGTSTKAKADDETNQIVIGYNAIGEGSNSVVLGNDSITKTLLKGNVTASGNISASGDILTSDDITALGTINGKLRHHTHHNMGFSNSDQKYIPINNISELTSVDKSRNVIIAPYDGKLVSAKVLTDNDAGASEINLNVNGVLASSISTTAVGANTVVTIPKNSTFSADDILAVNFNPGNNPGNVSITCIWEYDTNT